MDALLHHNKDHLLDATEAVQVPSQQYPNTLEGRRMRRAAALAKISGIWKDRADIPADGLEYERELRAEWQS